METGYETVCILRPEAGETGVKDVIKKAKSAIEGAGGSVAGIQEMGRKRLAYPIQKKNEGFYIVFTYGGVPASLKELDKYLRFNEDVIRYQTVRLDTLERAAAGAEEAVAAPEKAAEPTEKAEPAAETEKAAPAETAAPQEKAEPVAEKAAQTGEKTETPVEQAQENKGGVDA